MTLGSHQQCVGKSQTHITPKRFIDRLGLFDLDPCAASPRPWNCARRNFTEADDGLLKPWRGRVWLNPPYDRRTVADWIRKLAQHGHGTALLHARCETEWFGICWRAASGILFLDKRISFCRVDGTPHPHNSGAPPVLVAFGAEDLRRLRAANIGGELVTRWEHIGAASRRGNNVAPHDKEK